MKQMLAWLRNLNGYAVTLEHQQVASLALPCPEIRQYQSYAGELTSPPQGLLLFILRMVQFWRECEGRIYFDSRWTHTRGARVPGQDVAGLDCVQT